MKNIFTKLSKNKSKEGEQMKYASDDLSVQKIIRKNVIIETLSNTFFLLGGILYIWVAVIDLSFQKFVAEISLTFEDDTLFNSSYFDDDYYTEYYQEYYGMQKLRNETDFEDDYVFSIQMPNKPSVEDGSPSQYYVSKYQMIYFSAALSFLISGLITFLHERKSQRSKTLDELNKTTSCCAKRCSCCDKMSFPSSCLAQREWAAIAMILGGILGISSAMLVHDPPKANALNSASVHLYLLEGILVIGVHHGLRKSLLSRRQEQIMKLLYVLGDLLFIIGSFIDVTLSYVYLDPRFEFGVKLPKAAIFASVLWTVDALVYFASSLYLYCAYKKKLYQKDEKEIESKESRADSDSEEFVDTFEDDPSERVNTRRENANEDFVDEPSLTESTLKGRSKQSNMASSAKVVNEPDLKSCSENSGFEVRLVV